jgi:hypothetical protein
MPRKAHQDARFLVKVVKNIYSELNNWASRAQFSKELAIAEEHAQFTRQRT